MEPLDTCSLEFTLSALALVAAAVRRMLKTMGNISRVILNLTKILMFVTFKDSSSLPMFTQLTVSFPFS